MPVITHIEDLRVLAKRRVPRMFYDYADSGSYTESTYRANQSDFQKIKLRQRVAVNMENRSIRTKMIGEEVAMPVALSPVGLTGMQHADGEILAARAAEKFAKALHEATGVPVHLWDERLSTVAAERVLIEADLSRQKRRRVIDRAAAAYILQGFLDFRSRGGS